MSLFCCINLFLNFDHSKLLLLLVSISSPFCTFSHFNVFSCSSLTRCSVQVLYVLFLFYTFLIPIYCCLQPISTSQISSIPTFYSPSSISFLLFISSRSLFSRASLTPFIHLSSRQWLRFQRLLYMLHPIQHLIPVFFIHPLCPNLFLFFFFSISLLPLLSHSNLSPEGSDWQAGGWGVL